MNHSALVLFAAILVPTASAQLKAPANPVSWVYDPYVRQLGAQQFPGGGAALDDNITVVETLESGAVIVAGITRGSLGEPHAGASDMGDVFLARYNQRGFRQWISQIGAVTGPTIPALNGNPSGPGGDAAQYDSPADIAVAADGSIFVVGSTTGSLGETIAGGADLFLAKFDSAGTLLWLRQLGAETAAAIVPEPGSTNSGDASGYEAGASAVVHADGSVSVVGTTQSELSEGQIGYGDFLLARYGASGDLQWIRQMGEISAPMIGYDASDEEYSVGIALHPTGRIVLAGYKVFSNSYFHFERGIVMTFDDAGHPLDWVSLGNSTYPTDLAVHAPSGRILIGGEMRFFPLEGNWFEDAMAASLDGDLNLQWMSRMDAPSTSHLGLIDSAGGERVGGMCLDSAGNLVLGGATWTSLNEPNAGIDDVFTVKFRSVDGHILRVSQLGQSTAAALGIDATGDDWVGGLGLGPAGTISVGASTNGSFGEPVAGGYDALLLRLDRNGRLR